MSIQFGYSTTSPKQKEKRVVKLNEEAKEGAEPNTPIFNAGWVLLLPKLNLNRRELSNVKLQLCCYGRKWQERAESACLSNRMAFGKDSQSDHLAFFYYGVGNYHLLQFSLFCHSKIGRLIVVAHNQRPIPFCLYAVRVHHAERVSCGIPASHSNIFIGIMRTINC